MLQSTSLTALSNEIAALAQQASQSTVALHDRGHSFSGFYWRSDVIATAAELVSAKIGREIAVMTPSQDTVAGAVVRASTFLPISRSFEFSGNGAAVSAASTPPALGAIVLAAARTRHGPICAVGSVALAGARWRSMRGGDVGPRLWLDMRLRSYGEGGPVLDPAGQFIGMAVYGPRRRVLLIPAETVDRVGAELLAHGRIRRPYLGLGLQAVEISPSSSGGAAKSGLMIISLDPRGRAQQRDCQQGDIILAFDGTAVGSVRNLSALLRNAISASPQAWTFRVPGDR